MILAVTKDFSKFFADNYSEFDASKNVLIVGNGLYYTLFMIGCFAVVLAILIACIGFFGGSKKRSEAKGTLVWVIAIGLFIFCVGNLVQTLLNIGGSLKF